jgi:hypothetical protein
MEITVDRTLDAEQRGNQYFFTKSPISRDILSRGELTHSDSHLPDHGLSDERRHRFAELPASKPWNFLLDHASRLPGVEHAGLFALGGHGTRLCFDFRIYHFCIDDCGDARLSFSVDCDDCDELLLHLVQRHFAELLSPLMDD